MTARDMFWYDFAEMLYRNFYLSEYKCRVKLLDKIFTAFIIVVSTGSIGAWSIWGEWPYLWAILTAVSQVISLIKPLFHYAEIITCIDFCIPELDAIINEMEKEWRLIDSIDERSILKASAKFKKQYTELDAKYLNSLDFPERRSCRIAAMNKRDAYLAVYTDANIESEVMA